MREERGRKALGWGAVRYQNAPRQANARCAMVATQCVAMGVDWMAGTTTRGRMMWRIRNREGLKQAGEIRREPGGQNPRTEWFT